LKHSAIALLQYLVWSSFVPQYVT